VLDTVEGLLKTVDVFEKSIACAKVGLMFQIARCKVHKTKLCSLRDGIHLSSHAIPYFGVAYPFILSIFINCTSYSYHINIKYEIGTRLGDQNIRS
jgi:hypothetical protein